MVYFVSAKSIIEFLEIEGWRMSHLTIVYFVSVKSIIEFLEKEGWKISH